MMWSALKSDLFDFVNTIQADTTSTLQKVLGEDEEEIIDEQPLLDKLKANVKRSYETYANPLKENKAKEFEKYKKKFSLSSFAKDIAQVLDEEPEVSRFYAELVPVEISPEEFWGRLFFRLHLLNRNGSATFEDDDDEEELVWEDADEAKDSSSNVVDGSDWKKESIACQEKIKLLENENHNLRSEVYLLKERIKVLEAQLRQSTEIKGEQSTLKELESQTVPIVSSLIDTASVASSDSSSLLIVNNPADAVLSSVEESDVDIKRKDIPQQGNQSGEKLLAALDDEEDEDGWS